MAKTWEELGAKVSSARADRKLTQQELASAVGLDRTALSKIESGQRTVDSIELFRIARAVDRPLGWFLAEPVPAVVSRRAARGERSLDEDIQLESLALDVEQMVELGMAVPPVLPAMEVQSVAAAERAADDARALAGLSATEPVWDLVRIVERLGLYSFVLPLAGDFEGSYVALRRGGVALINRHGESGRRRFTIAHELGHHVLADEYATEWVVGSGATEREKIINAFAVHFLLPRRALAERSLAILADPRDAAIRIGVEYGLSWSATCAQLNRLGGVSDAVYDDLLAHPPKRFDLIARELTIRSDVDGTIVPPGYAASVIRALDHGKIGPNRALELLHHTITARDLPPERPLSLDAMTSEIAPLPR